MYKAFSVLILLREKRYSKFNLTLSIPLVAVLQISFCYALNSLSNSKEKFIVDLDKFLEEFHETIDCLYLVCDMNFDLLKQDSITEKYTHVFINRGEEQTIADATRICERSSTLIDHIICNRNMFLSSKVIPITITDHNATSITMP